MDEEKDIVEITGDSDGEAEGSFEEPELSAEEAAEIAAEDGVSELEKKKALAMEAEAFSRQMKDEYNKAMKAEKQRQKEKKGSSGSGRSLWACAGVSAAVSLAVIALVFVILFIAKVPFTNYSIMDVIMSRYSSSQGGGSVSAEPEDTVVGGTTVPGGSDVVINIDGSEDDNAAAVYAKCSQSIVGIRVVSSVNGSAWRNEYEIVGEGSGVVYSADGYIITNHHVISKAIGNSGGVAAGYEIRVYFDTTLSSYSVAKIIGSDETTDLALIKINGENLKPIEIATSAELNVGDKVYAIGSPGGLEFMNSLSDGVISGLNREMSTDTGISYDLIQTNTAINPGNSGGALLNREGKLIGICFLKIVADGYEGMGFAISSDTVVEIISEIEENGAVSRPVLGITVNTLYNATEAQSSGLPAGAWIEEVAKNSAADEAGMEANSIITVFNGAEISDYSGLRQELLKYKPGDSVTVRCYCYNTATQAGEYKDYTVVLGEAE